MHLEVWPCFPRAGPARIISRGRRESLLQTNAFQFVVPLNLYQTLLSPNSVNVLPTEDRNSSSK